MRWSVVVLVLCTAILMLRSAVQAPRAIVTVTADPVVRS